MYVSTCLFSLYNNRYNIISQYGTYLLRKTQFKREPHIINSELYVYLRTNSTCGSVKK